MATASELLAQVETAIETALGNMGTGGGAVKSYLYNGRRVEYTDPQATLADLRAMRKELRRELDEVASGNVRLGDLSG